MRPNKRPTGAKIHLAGSRIEAHHTALRSSPACVGVRATMSETWCLFAHRSSKTQRPKKLSHLYFKYKSTFEITSTILEDLSSRKGSDGRVDRSTSFVQITQKKALSSTELFLKHAHQIAPRLAGDRRCIPKADLRDDHLLVDIISRSRSWSSLRTPHVRDHAKEKNIDINKTYAR